MGVASLVLGTLSIITGVFSLGALGSWGMVMGIIGIILGAWERKSKPEGLLALIGLIVSIIGTVLSMLFYIACIGCIALVD